MNRRARADARRLALAILGAVGCLISIASDGLAQIDSHYISFSGRPWGEANGCLDAPIACEGATDVPLTERTEFDLRLLGFPTSPVDSVQFSVRWPPAWGFVALETCAAELLSGTPSEQGSRLRFRVDSCANDSFIVRLIFSTPTPGTLELGGDTRVYFCGGGSASHSYDQWVNVGEACGMEPDSGCSFCARFNSASFGTNPLELSVVAGQSLARLVSFFPENECPSLPECGGTNPNSCYVGLNSPDPWLSWTFYSPTYLRVQIDASDLSPGLVVGTIEAPASPFCGRCRPTCLSVVLHVFERATGIDAAAVPPRVSVQVVPNPTDNQLRYLVNAPDAGDVRLSIVDPSGRTRASWREANLRAGANDFSRAIDRADLGRGVYFLVATGAGWSDRAQFVLAD